MYRYFTILALLIPLFGFQAPDKKIDSLYNSLSKVNDSAQVDILAKLTWELRNSEPNKSIELGIKAIESAERYKDYKNLVNLHGYVGVAYRIIGNYSKSTDYYYKGLELAKKYKLQEQEGFAYINIANLLIYQEYYTNAIENLNNAFEIAKKINNKLMLSYVHLNRGRTNLLLKQYDSAFVDLNTALKIRQEINNKQGISVCYKYIGDLYKEREDYFLAIENYNKSQQLVNIETDKDLYANILARKAELFLKTGDTENAQKYAQSAYDIAKVIGAKLTIRDALKVITQVAKGHEHYRLATGNLESIIRYNDTLFNQQLSEKLFFLQYQYEKQKKESEIEIKELKLKRVRSISLALISIIILLVGSIVFVLISLKHRKKVNKQLVHQNAEINDQRKNIEFKNQNLEEAYGIIESYIGKITDNIRYAERIQEALLPSLELAKPQFSDVFCFYKPKDFVSGDFYWLLQKNNKLFFAVADCTGHGVPGAFMSIIGLDMLNQAVGQQNITDPDKILSFINAELPLKLNFGIEEMVLKDSMDIAVCCFDKETMILSYAGALIPLFICRDGVIIEEKPSPILIGLSEKIHDSNFTLKKIELQKNDWVFVYTDGFVDQFGGELNKKFLKKQFLKLLTDNSHANGANYIEQLESTFSTWKGAGEQIDDVLVLGMKV